MTYQSKGWLTHADFVSQLVSNYRQNQIPMQCLQKVDVRTFKPFSGFCLTSIFVLADKIGLCKSALRFSFDNISTDLQNNQVLRLYSAPKMLKLIFLKMARHYEMMTSSQKNIWKNFSFPSCQPTVKIS